MIGSTQNASSETSRQDYKQYQIPVNLFSKIHKLSRHLGGGGGGGGQNLKTKLDTSLTLKFNLPHVRTPLTSQFRCQIIVISWL